MVAHETIVEAPGAAPWLVLLHGFSQDRRVFSGQIGAFRGRYRLLLVDLPGHGAASASPGPYGHAELAAAVRAVIELAIGPATRCALWGTHTGAAIALLLASCDASRYTSLVLEGAVLPGRTIASVAQAYLRMQRIARQLGVEPARRAWFDKSGWFDVMRERPLECRADEHRRMIDDFSGRPWLEPGAPAPVDVGDAALAAIDLPALVYNGERDVDDFVSVAGHLERLLPRAERCVIPEAGGFPGWKFPERVNVRVKAFLQPILAPTMARDKT